MERGLAHVASYILDSISPSEVSMTAHLKGKYHQSALRRQGASEYFCDVCNVHTNGGEEDIPDLQCVGSESSFSPAEASMQDHLRGKHHLAKMRPLQDYVCELCNVHVTSGEKPYTKRGRGGGDLKLRLETLCVAHWLYHPEDSLQAHLRGRPHQKVARMAAITERTIYVRGFPPEEVQEEDLRQLFLEFGEVRSVSLDMAKVGSIA